MSVYRKKPGYSLERTSKYYMDPSRRNGPVRIIVPAYKTNHLQESSVTGCLSELKNKSISLRKTKYSKAQLEEMKKLIIS